MQQIQTRQLGFFSQQGQLLIVQFGLFSLREKPELLLDAFAISIEEWPGFQICQRGICLMQQGRGILREVGSSGNPQTAKEAVPDHRGDIVRPAASEQSQNARSRDRAFGQLSGRIRGGWSGSSHSQAPG